MRYLFILFLLIACGTEPELPEPEPTNIRGEWESRLLIHDGDTSHLQKDINHSVLRLRMDSTFSWSRYASNGESSWLDKSFNGVYTNTDKVVVFETEDQYDVYQTEYSFQLDSALIEANKVYLVLERNDSTEVFEKVN